MAERRATNKYYPPEWTPEQGSINKFRGTHHLRERARKLDQGILIVRFEMPYNVWCLGCNQHIGMGVRYNAEKKQVGNYFSTKIWSFRMKCHLCSHWMEIRTDPKNTAYVCYEGVRKKEEEWIPEAGDQIALANEDQREQLDTNPLFRLEHQLEDKTKAEKELIPVLSKLKDFKDARKDDYELSKLLRKKFRETKKEEAKKLEESYRPQLDMHLVDEEEEDVRLAKRIRYQASQAKERQLELRSASIFSNSNNNNNNNSSSSNSKPGSLPSTSSSSSSTAAANGNSGSSKKLSIPLAKARAIAKNLQLAAPSTTDNSSSSSSSCITANIKVVAKKKKKQNNDPQQQQTPDNNDSKPQQQKQQQEQGQKTNNNNNNNQQALPAPSPSSSSTTTTTTTTTTTKGSLSLLASSYDDDSASSGSDHDNE